MKTYPTKPGAVLALVFVLSIASTAAGQTLSNGIKFPTGVPFDGEFLYVSHGEGYRDMLKVDAGTGAVLASIPLGGEPRDVVYDGAGHFFASDRGFCAESSPCGVVREIDSAGNEIATFPIPFRGGAIAFDGTRLYVGDTDSSAVIVTDRTGNQLYSFDSGLRPEGMVFDPVTGNLRVITLFDSKIYEITTNGQFVRACDSPYDPGPFGLGGITIVGSAFVVAQALVPADPNAGTQILFVERSGLVCQPSECTETTPIIENAAASPSVLWPPNFEMIEVTISYDLVDLCDLATGSLTVTSNQGEVTDFEVVDANHVRLRATPSGTGPDRVYSITITALDESGHSATKVLTVTVPHDMGD